MKVGAHESAAGGPFKAVQRAIDDQCESMQIFVKNNNRWAQRMWNDDEAALFRDAYADTDLDGLMAHAAYLINLCSPTIETREKSIVALSDELARCALLDVPYLVFHPGSHMGEGESVGIDIIASKVNQILEEDDGDTMLLFENTAGQGTNLGWRHEHLRDLLGLVDDIDRCGICFDTCHAHAAGYDLTDEASYEEHWELFDAVIGLEHLCAFHLNDSKKPLGSRVDRHENIGEGEIGEETFRLLMNDSRFEQLPGVVETPPLESGEMSFAHNIALLKSYRE